MNYKEKLTIIGETLWALIIIGGIVVYSWQHSMLLLLWIGFLLVHLIATLRKYSNIEYKTVNNIYNVKTVEHKPHKRNGEV